ncbi:microtubule-associated protein futsch isoform X2 [Plutella xylostella]|uniref:microtubule-associated protein futsch isoform X2 n=1 Tax=Plutella xylostella TaxID=51655 RepID=UPI0020327DCA|nr:microtubule-associated protein futsch isoform X2 [Plutella xylostella]
MDHDEERSLSLGTELSASVPPPSPLTGCYLLAVIGEPHTAQHKEIILQRLVKGLLSWDSGEHQVDLERELAALTAQAPEGEEARYGERLIQFASENLVTEILIHPQMNTLMQCMRNLLSSFTRHRHLVHAGYTFSGNGSWIMQDGTFSLADFTDAFQENEVQRVIRAYENSISIDVHCATGGGGEWHKLSELPFVKHCRIRVNPTDILDSGSQAIKDFIGYLDPYIIPASLEQLLVASDVVGNIRFSHPTLYVFPGGQGDAALFGINGFNMLVDGGFSRKACWWDFARHLDRLDAVLLTRLNNCSVAGMAAVLRRKAAANVYPQIGHFFCNLEERRVLASPDGDKDADPLLVSLHQEGSDMMADLRHLNLKPQYCYRGPEPINLYHKVGHGTLDMYVLNPSKDSKYVRDFLKKWHNSEQKLFEGASASGQFNFPIPNLVSICALLVWRPANPDDTITRIMFPGSTPQHKIFEGLEKLKHLEFLQHPTCTGRQVKASPPPTTSAATTTTTRTTKHAVSKTSKERTITTEKKEDKTIDTEPISTKISTFKDETDSKNVIDNKLLNELVDGDDKKIESVLQEAIIARAETKLDDKIAQYENAVIDSVPKKKDIRKKKENVTEKKTKRIEKTDETKDSVGKIEVKKTESKVDSRKRTETRAKSETVTSISRSKVSHRASMQKSIEKKVSSTVTDKKGSEDKKSPPATPKKSVESKTTAKESTASATVRVKTKARKLSPGSTPAKSTKEANNRRVVESKYKQASPKRDVTSKPTEKKEVKKREPISRRPRPLASPVKGIKAMKSPIKSVKSVKVDPKLKGLQRVNYEDILRDAKKSDEETSKSLDDFKQDIDDKEEQEIVREIEAVFNRDSEAEEKIEYIGRSDIEKITCLLDNTKTEVTGDSEFEEEYLIIEKEEIDQFTEDSIADRSSNEKEDELKKHTKDKEESEKRKEEITIRTVKESEIPFEVKVKSETITNGESKQPESKEHSVSVEEKQDLSSEKKTSDSKSGIAKPKDSLENIIQESQPDEKVSTTIESGATTTAPTLPEDERITLDEIKEDQLVEEKHVKEDTKEQVPPHTQVDVQPPPSEKSLKLEPLPAPIREIVKTPDEVADLPLHEEVDYRTYEEKKTPGEEDVFKRKPDVGFVHEIRVPKDLPLPDKEAAVSYSGIKTIQGDIVHTMVERPSHAELVTVTPGSAPESPMYPQPTKDGEQMIDLRRELEPVKEYESEYNYGEYTEKLRETHITTLDSPIKDDIIIVEETASMPEKIPSIPEDVEKEIEEARTLEGEKSPIKSPKEVLRIVADVAEVLKSDKSLEEIIAGKTPIRLKSPEHFFKSDMLTTSTIESTISFLTSESETKDEQIQKDAADKTSSQLTVDATNEDSTRKEISPVRSVTSEDISDVSDKTVLSEGKRSKREVKDEKLLHLDESKVLSKEKVIADSEEKEILDKDKDQQQKDIQVSDIMTSSTLAFGVEESIPEKRVSLTHDSAKTLERLDEKLADLKKKDEIMHQKAISTLEDTVEADALDTEDTKIEISFDTVTTEEATSTFVDMKKESASRPENVDSSSMTTKQETLESSQEMIVSETIKTDKELSVDKETSIVSTLKDAAGIIDNETSAPSEKDKVTNVVTSEKDVTPSPVISEKESSPVPSEKKSSLAPTGKDDIPKKEMTPSLGITEKESSAIQLEKELSAGPSDKDKAPSVAVSEKDVTPSPVVSEKESSLVPSEKEPSPALSEKDKIPSEVVSEKEMAPSPMVSERIASPVPSEKEPSLTPSDKDKAPSVVQSAKDVTPSPVVSEKVLSPALSEKAPSPAPLDKDEIPSEVASEKYKIPSPAISEKESSPVQSEDGSATTEKDRASSVVKSDKHGTPSPVAPEKELSPVPTEDEKLPSSGPSQKDGTLSPVASEKTASPVSSEKQLTPAPSYKEQATSVDLCEKDVTSVISEKESSPVLSEKEPSEASPEKDKIPSEFASEKEEEMTPSLTISEKESSPIKSVKETSPATSDKAPSVALFEKDKTLSPATSENDHPVQSEPELSSATADKEKTPSVAKSEKDGTISQEISEKAASPVSSEKESSPGPSDKDKTPSVAPSEKDLTPSPVISDKEPSPAPSKKDKIPSEVASEIDMTSSPAISEKDHPILSERELVSATAEKEKTPSVPKSEKDALSPDLSEKAASQVSSEKESSPAPSDKDKIPSIAASDKDLTPSPVISDKEPSPAPSEKDEITSEEGFKKEITPIPVISETEKSSVQSEKELSSAEKDKAPSEASSEKDLASSPVISDKEPSPAPSEKDKIPSEVTSEIDMTSSPVISEKDHPVQSESELVSATEKKEKTPSVPKSEKDDTLSPDLSEKAASQVSTEKESSPAPSDKDKIDSIAASEKDLTPSPAPLNKDIIPSKEKFEKEMTPSPVISEKDTVPVQSEKELGLAEKDKAPSVVKSEKDKTPSPGVSEKTPSPVSLEKESSSAPSDIDKAPSVVQSEKDLTPSPVICDKETIPVLSEKDKIPTEVASKKEMTPSPAISEKEFSPVSSDKELGLTTYEKDEAPSIADFEKDGALSPLASEKEHSPSLPEKQKLPSVGASEQDGTPSPLMSQKDSSPDPLMKDKLPSVAAYDKDETPSLAISGKEPSPVSSEKEPSPPPSDKDKQPWAISEIDGTTLPVVSAKEHSSEEDKIASVDSSEKDGALSPATSEKEASPILSLKKLSPDKDKLPHEEASEKDVTPSPEASKKELSPVTGEIDKIPSVVSSAKDEAPSPMPAGKRDSPDLSQTDKTPSVAAPEKDVTPSPIASIKSVSPVPLKIEPSLVSTEDKLPSVAISRKDGTQSPVVSDKDASPVQAEQESSPTEAPKDKASPSVAMFEKDGTPSPLPSEKALSPAQSDKDTASIVVASVKSPVLAEKETSPAPSKTNKTSEKDEKLIPTTSEKEAILVISKEESGKAPSENAFTLSSVASDIEPSPAKAVKDEISSVISDKDEALSATTLEKEAKQVVLEKERLSTLSEDDKPTEDEKKLTPSPLAPTGPLPVGTETIERDHKELDEIDSASVERVTSVSKEALILDDIEPISLSVSGVEDKILVIAKQPSPLISIKEPSPEELSVEDDIISMKIVESATQESSPTPSEKKQITKDVRDKMPCLAQTDATSEQAPSPASSEELLEKTPSLARSDSTLEKALSPTPSEKAISPVPPEDLAEKSPGLAPTEVISEKALSPTPSEKAPSPLPSEVTTEKRPSLAMSDATSEKSVSSTPSEKEQITKDLGDKETSLIPLDASSEKSITPTPSEKAISPVPSEDSTEKRPSLAISDTTSDKALSPTPSEKEHIIKNLGDKETSRVPLDATSEKALTPTPSEKAISPVPSEDLAEKSHGIAPSEVTSEKALSSTSSEKMPSTLSSEVITEKRQSLTVSDATSEKAVTPTPSENEQITGDLGEKEATLAPSNVTSDKALSPAPSEKASSPAPSEDLTDKKHSLAPSDIIADKALSPAPSDDLTEKSSSLAPSDKISDKALSPTPSDKVLSPLPFEDLTEKRPSLITSGASSEKVVSSMPSEKEQISKELGEKKPSLTPSDAISEQAPSPVPSEDLTEKRPSLAATDIISEKALSPTPSEKAISPLPSEDLIEKRPSPSISASEKAVTCTPSEKELTKDLDEKRPSLAQSDATSEKVISPPPSEKAISPLAFEDLTQKRPSLSISEKEEITKDLGDKSPSLAPSDAIPVKVPTHAPSEDLTDKKPSLATSDVSSEKAISPTPFENVISPVPSENLSEKSRSLALSDVTSEKAPSPTPSEKPSSPVQSEDLAEKSASRAASEVISDKASGTPSEKAPSPFASEELTEKRPSLAISDATSEKAVSPSLSEKEEITNDLDDKRPSLAPSEALSERSPSSAPSEDLAEKRPSLATTEVLSEKAPSPTPSEKAISPLPSEDLSKKRPSLTPSDVISEKAVSPTPSDKVQSPLPSEDFTEKRPSSSIYTSEKAVTPTPSEKEQITKGLGDKRPSLAPSDATSEKATSPTPSEKAISPVPSEDLDDKRPSLAPSDATSEKVASPTPSEKALSPAPSEKEQITKDVSDKRPSLAQTDATSEQAPTLAPSEKLADKRPSLTPSDVISEKAVSPIPSEKAISSEPSGKEQLTKDASDKRDVTSEQAPSPAPSEDLEEKKPSLTIPDVISEKALSPLPSEELADKGPSLASSDATSEKVTSPTPSDGALSPAPSEKEQLTKDASDKRDVTSEQAPRPAPSEDLEEKKPSLATTDVISEKALSPLPSEELADKRPSLAPSDGISEKVVSPTPSDKVQSPLPSEDFTEKQPSSSIYTSEKAVTPTPSEKEQITKDLGDKRPSLAPSDATSEKATSPTPSEKAISPVPSEDLDDKRPSLAPSDATSEKVASATPSEKALSPAPSEREQITKDVSGKRDVTSEQAPSPAPSEDLEEKKPSLATTDVISEKALSPLPSEELADKRSSLASSDATSEKVTSPTPSDKALSPAPSEKEQFTKDASDKRDVTSEQTPSPAPSEDLEEKKPSLATTDVISGKALSPLLSDELADKRPSLAPLDATSEKVTSPTPSDKALSPAPSEKEQITKDLEDKRPSLAPSDATSEKASSPTPSEKAISPLPSHDLDDKRPSLAPSDATSEKVTSPTPSDKALSPAPSEKEQLTKDVSDKRDVTSEQTPSPAPSEDLEEKKPSLATTDVISEKALSPLPSEELADKGPSLASSDATSEKVISPTPSDGALSPAPSEKEQLTKDASDKRDVTSEQAPRPAPSEDLEEKKPSLATTDVISEKALSPLPSEELADKRPSLAPSDGISEKVVSPTPSDKVQSPLPSEDFTEKRPSSSIYTSEKAVTPTPSEKEQITKDLGDKRPSLAPSDATSEKATSPTPSEKAISPVPSEDLDDKRPSLAPSDATSEKVTSPTPSDKALSPAPSEKEQLTKDASDKRDVTSEQTPSPAPSEDLEEKKPSLATTDVISEKALSPLPSEELADKRPSLAPSDGISETALSPRPSEKAQSPVPSEDLTDKLPSLLSPSEKVTPFPSKKEQISKDLGDKLPSLVASDATLEKPISPTPSEKSMSPVASEDLAQKRPSLSISEKEQITKDLGDKRPSLALSDAVSQQASSPAPSEDFSEKSPSLAPSEVISEKALIEHTPSNKTPSPLASGDIMEKRPSLPTSDATADKIVSLIQSEKEQVTIDIGDKKPSLDLSDAKSEKAPSSRLPITDQYEKPEEVTRSPSLVDEDEFDSLKERQEPESKSFFGKVSDAFTSIKEAFIDDKIEHRDEIVKETEYVKETSNKKEVIQSESKLHKADDDKDIDESEWEILSSDIVKDLGTHLSSTTETNQTDSKETTHTITDKDRNGFSDKSKETTEKLTETVKKDEKDSYDDGESLSEDSQIEIKVGVQETTRKSTLPSTVAAPEWISQSLSTMSKPVGSSKEFTEEAHQIKKRSIEEFEQKVSQISSEMATKISSTDREDIDNDSLGQSIPLGGSSEDVSREISLEEKYSFEGTEKETRGKKIINVEKTTQESSTSHDASTFTDSFKSISSYKSDESFINGHSSSHISSSTTLKGSDAVQYLTGSETKGSKTGFSDAGSPKEDIILSEASDSGIHSIPVDIDQMKSSSDDGSSLTLKENASQLMEGIQKAFGEDNVQQGIKNEGLDSLIVHSEYDRASTPPTVPVSPLPKTPISFQDIKVCEGIQSEVSYDKSEGADDTITKVVHVGDDIVTQRISTSTEKVPKTLKSTTDLDGDADLTSLLHTVGKIKTETDTVTKIMKEGENLVTQTITTVTTKEIISREDGTPQNVKTTIETTTLSKNSDGSTTTTKDTQTLMSECSSSLKSTSQMDLYAKDSKLEKEYLESSEEKSESLSSQIEDETSSLKINGQDASIAKENVNNGEGISTSSFITTEIDDENVEDTIIDTDVQKKIIKENNVDIMVTIMTVTKKETLKIDDRNKTVRTTIETNTTKERPDGSKEVLKNVEVRTEEIDVSSHSNINDILSELIPQGEPEETTETNEQEIKDNNIIIKRTTLTKITKTRYADSQGIIRKIKIVTLITTTDNYPDGSSRTQVDSDTSISDVQIEDELRPQDLIDCTEVEEKSVAVDTQEKIVTINGKNVKQTVTITTTKEIFTNLDKSKKKLRKTVETVTETLLPDGVTEVSKDVKVSIQNVDEDQVEDNLDDYELINKPDEDTTSQTETVEENGILIKRKTTITTIRQQYYNKAKTTKLIKTTVKTLIEDEYPDGSVITKTSEKVSLVEESLQTATSDESNNITEIRADLKYTDSDETDVHESSGSDVESILNKLTVLEDPEDTESKQFEEVKENGITIWRTIVTRIIKTKYCDDKGIPKKIKTITTVATTDQFPDGSSKTTVDTNTSVSDIETEDITQSNDLQEYPTVQDKTVTVDTKENLITVDGIEAIQIITTTTTKETLSSVDGSKKKIKTTDEILTETKLPNGVTEVTKDTKVSVADYGIEIVNENLEGYNLVGEPDEQSTTTTETVFENGKKIVRKITVTTIRQEFVSISSASKKIRTTIRTVTEDEYPDGTIITKKSEKVSIADIFLKTPPAAETSESESHIDDTEVVEDTTEDVDVKNEIVQKDTIKIKRTITTTTKRETLTSSDKNVKRVRTTVETLTVDEYPDGSTETTKDVKITISESQNTSNSNLLAALEGLEPTGKTKHSVDKKSNIITENNEKITQTITSYITKEELMNIKTKEVAVKTVTETITENERTNGSVETTKDVRTQITYLPIGTSLDDWSPEELKEIEKQSVDQKKISGETLELPLEQKDELKSETKPKKQKSPIGEITTDTDTFTKVLKEGDNEITQTITVVTTKEVISPEKVKVTIETTTVSKGSDGVTKTTKSTKTTISEYKEEFEETIDTGESEKSFSKNSSKTGDMRSSSAASDDLDHHGISSPPSEISSRGSRAATNVWGTESSGLYYSDDDGPGSPSSTKSQVAHSPRSNLSFDLETKMPDQRESQEILFDISTDYKDPMSTSIYGQLPEEDSCTSSTHSEIKTEMHVTEKPVTKLMEDFLSHEKSKAEQTMHTVKTTSDATFFKEADDHFEKAIEEHKKVSGTHVISNITAKYELDEQAHSSTSQHSSSTEETITLKDLTSKKHAESSSSSVSQQESKTEKKEQKSETLTSKLKDPIESWGKPLGLPSPIGAPTPDGKSTPKKQAASVLNKNKLNQEKSKEGKKASESPSKKKSPAPVYLELTYVPHHGNSYYSAVEFFKRVRARYYVFSGTEPSKEIYNALLDAKKTWEDKDLEVTIIPTYDTDVLGYWVTENEEALERYKIDLSPSASRCTINLQDHETSCAAYRLEF